MRRYGTTIRGGRATLRVLGSLTLAAALCGGCTSAPKADPAAPRAYAFWPLAPAEPRVQFLRSYARTTDLTSTGQTGFERLVFGAEVEQSVAINKPYGVAMRDGRIYICDIRNRDVTVLDLAKRQARLMGATGLNRLQQPVDVAVADDGLIYVADKSRGVVMFDQSERYVQVLGGGDFQPVSLALHGDRIYVCNMAKQCVDILDRRDGRVIGTIGTIGDHDGQFRLPLGIDVDPQGNVHVVDIMRCRLQKFSPEGSLLAATGEMTDTAGNFVRPKHVAVDQDGLVYVVDAAFQNVQIFDAQYRLLTSFGAAGDHPGSMNLPVGICAAQGSVDLPGDLVHPAFAARRLIVVTNQFGPHKVAMYAVGGLAPGKTVQDVSTVQIQTAAGTRAPGGPDLLGQLGTEPLTEETDPPRPK
jgi:DNA-binding beta-propeller fold protein YncE